MSGEIVAQKPLPRESVYIHLRMLVDYLSESALDDSVLNRKAVKLKVCVPLSVIRVQEPSRS